jgi:hypothetical protein
MSDSAVLEYGTDIEKLKDIGSIWGGWRTWRNCGTDNVICNDISKAVDLIQRDFHKTCNFYVPKNAYAMLDRPHGVQLFEGEFKFEVDNQDELVAIHLVSGRSDIVLLFGFDWRKVNPSADRLVEHRAQNYRNTIKQALTDNPDIQWVLIDHPEGELMPEIARLGNLTQDTLPNVLAMFNS